MPSCGGGARRRACEAIAILVLSLPVSARAAEAPAIAVFSYAEEPGASGIATRAGEAVIRRAGTHGLRAGIAARVGELLDRAPDDLVRTADALAAGRGAYQEGIELA